MISPSNRNLASLAYLRWVLSASAFSISHRIRASALQLRCIGAKKSDIACFVEVAARQLQDRLRCAFLASAEAVTVEFEKQDSHHKARALAAVYKRMCCARCPTYTRQPCGQYRETRHRRIGVAVEAALISASHHRAIRPRRRAERAGYRAAPAHRARRSGLAPPLGENAECVAASGNDGRIWSGASRGGCLQRNLNSAPVKFGIARAFC
jgi:hypothetical protein